MKAVDSHFTSRATAASPPLCRSPRCPSPCPSCQTRAVHLPFPLPSCPFPKLLPAECPTRGSGSTPLRVTSLPLPRLSGAKQTGCFTSWGASHHRLSDFGSHMGSFSSKIRSKDLFSSFLPRLKLRVPQRHLLKAILQLLLTVDSTIPISDLNPPLISLGILSCTHVLLRALFCSSAPWPRLLLLSPSWVLAWEVCPAGPTAVP